MVSRCLDTRTAGLSFSWPPMTLSSAASVLMWGQITTKIGSFFHTILHCLINDTEWVRSILSAAALCVFRVMQPTCTCAANQIVAEAPHGFSLSTDTDWDFPTRCLRGLKCIQLPLAASLAWRGPQGALLYLQHCTVRTMNSISDEWLLERLLLVS